VVSGSYQDIEVIVSDNAAAAKTRAVVESFNDSRVRYRSNSTNLGIAGNHLAAMAEMRGDFFSILNDDDEWERALLTTLVPILEQRDEVAVAFSDHYIIDEQSRLDIQESDVNTKRWKRDTLSAGIHRPFYALGLVQQSIPFVMGAVVRTAAIDFQDFPAEVGPHYDLWLTYLAARTGLAAYYVPERLVRYRVHAGSHTASRSTQSSAATLYICSRFVEDQRLAEYAAIFRARYMDAQVAHGLALLRRGSIDQARSQLFEAFRTRMNLKAATALIISLIGATGSRGLLGTYDQLRAAAVKLRRDGWRGTLG